MPLAPNLEDLLADPSRPPTRNWAAECAWRGPLVCHRCPCHVIILPGDDALDGVIAGRYESIPATCALVAPRGSLLAIRTRSDAAAVLHWMAITDTPLTGNARVVPLQGNHLRHLWHYLATAQAMDAGLQTLVRSLLVTGLHQGVTPAGE